MLEYPIYNENGATVLCKMGEKHASMLMNIYVVRLHAGSTYTYGDAENESAILITEGKIKVTFEGRTETMHRKNPFEEMPFCLHTCRGKEVTVVAEEECEFILQQTDNEKIFDTVFYTPEMCRRDEFGKGQWNGTGHRIVVTVFDLDNAPYSNMVIGEVFNKPGRWSSYPPHHHPQPEVYVYKFDYKQGFGACFNGDDVYKSTDGSFCTIENGKSHQQVTAPGYTMYYCWMIRHLDGDPWDKTRIYDEEHEWLAHAD